jgi:uncharacterized repeat protein (TIGR01451 family)
LVAIILIFSLGTSVEGQLSLTKKANITFNAPVGGVIEYSFSIKNEGSEPLYNLRLYDDKMGDLTHLLQNRDLQPGKYENCTRLCPTDETMLPVISNTATATADNGTGEFTAFATEDVVFAHNAALNTVKEVSKSPAAAGEVISYTIYLINTGDVTLADLQLSDPMLGGNLTSLLNRTEIGPGEVAMAVVSYTVAEEDIDPEGLIRNYCRGEGTVKYDPTMGHPSNIGNANLLVD